MTLRCTLDFLLYQWRGAESLTRRERFADHSRATFDAVRERCEALTNVALAANAIKSIAVTVGRMGAKRYFCQYELPKTGAWLAVVASRDATCADYSEAWF